MTKTMKSGKVNGTAFHEEGEGPVVVLIHGLGLNLDVWQWQLNALTKHHTVLTYDLLGHGNSVKPEGAYTMAQMVDQLYRLVEARGHDRFAVIGFSLGGLIAQAFTLAHPDRVTALGVMNSAHARTAEQRAGIMVRVEQCRADGPGATVSDALSRWFSEGFAKKNPELLGQVRQWVMANDPRVYPELYKLLADGDIGLEQSVAAIQCPALIFTGDEDYGNSPEMAARMADTIPNAKLVVAKGLRHMALAEDPQQVNDMLVAFLGEALK